MEKPISIEIVEGINVYYFFKNDPIRRYFTTMSEVCFIHQEASENVEESDSEDDEDLLGF